jgi:hypothetical protein
MHLNVNIIVTHFFFSQLQVIRNVSFAAPVKSVAYCLEKGARFSLIILLHLIFLLYNQCS